jgi:phage-related protein (TIGR01555 family)
VTSVYQRAIQGTADIARMVRDRLTSDAWINLTTGLGGSGDRSTLAQVAAFAPLDYRVLEALYHGSDLAATIVNRLPEDALSRGFSFEGSPDLDRAAERWDLGERIKDGRTWARLGGVGGILIGSRDGALASPLRIKDFRKGDLQYLLPVDRADIHGVDIDTRPQSPRFGEPAMYQIGQISNKVHPSRIVLFPGARTSPRMRKLNGGWDISVLQRPYEVLRDTDTVWRSVIGMMQDASQAVFKIRGLMEMIANGQSNVLLQRMEVVNAARSVARATLVDAEGEDYTHVGAANLTGIDPLVMRTLQRLASAADMPVSILLGMSASGLNASGAGDSDLRIWAARVVSERALLARAIMYLGAVIAADAALPPPKGVDWPALWDETDKERADREQVRANTSKVRIDASITTPEDEARILAGDDLEVVLRERLEMDELEALDPDDDSIDVAAGSLWIDTATGSRLQVRSVGEGRVFFVNLDAENPNAQKAWVRRVFLARCHKAPSLETGPESGDAPAGPGAAPAEVPENALP